MFKKFLLLTAAWLLCLLPLRAQFYIGVHGGVTLPTGYYGDSRMSDNEWMMTEGHQLRAGAGTGFSGGVDFSYSMPFLNDLSVLFSVDFLQSGPNKDVRNYYNGTFAKRYENYDDYEMILPKYRNIPILLGLRYSYPLGTFYDLYGEAQMGVNIRQLTAWQLSFASGEFKTDDGVLPSYTYKETYAYEDRVTLAFHLGAGIMIRDIVSVGAGVHLLGKAPLSWDNTVTTSYNTPGGKHEGSATDHRDYTDMNPTMVFINLGFHINPFKNYTRRVQEN